MDGLLLGAEWQPHERTVMGWPTSVRVATLWHGQLDAARDVHATVAAAIARREPVLMVANSADAEDAARRCGDGVEVLSAAIDDSWLRDSGPIVVRRSDGSRLGVHFGFNGWGRSFEPFDADAAVGETVLDHLGIECRDATDFIFEGGSIAVDGTGLAVTTERCLLNPNRNPQLDRAGVEAQLLEHLGIDRVVWLAEGIAEDEGTDGHVDNVVAFAAPGRVILQGCGDRANPNHAIARDNRARLIDAGLDVVEIPDLPYAKVAGEVVPVPYVNFYVANGAVFVPTVDFGDPLDADQRRCLGLIGEQFPDRDVVPQPGEVLAYGGGGIHCITQQIPARDDGSS